MKDSQDWLDIDEVLENLWYEAAHDAEPIGSAVSKAKSAIREHFLKEALEMIDSAPKLILKGKFEDDMGLFGDYVEVAELRNKFNDKYKED